MAKHNTDGEEAETAVADYLLAQGYQIVDRNWKTRWAEIDIVAEKRKVIHFVEVKYRASDTQGGGFEYITPQKLRQMARASEIWVSSKGWDGEYVLSAAQVSGPGFDIEFLADCS